MTSDCELLRRYAEQGDEAAFAEVVGRHVDLVYSAALRLVGGDAHLAQDVAQEVFTALARRAARVARHASIVGWLYTTTRYTVGNLRRSQHRRRAREQEAYAMNQPAQSSEINWDVLQPVLDEAVCALAAADREAVLLRFFQNKSHREVGDALGLGEEAARKRVDRALEKLRAHFARRGVAVSAGVLAAEIGANSVQAAPVGLAVTLSGGAIAGAVKLGIIGTILNLLSMTTKTKIAWAAMIIAVFSTTSAIYEHHQANHLRTDLAAIAKSKSTSTSGSVASPATTTAERLALIEKIIRSQKPKAETTRDLLDLFAQDVTTELMSDARVVELEIELAQVNAAGKLFLPSTEMSCTTELSRDRPVGSVSIHWDAASGSCSSQFAAMLVIALLAAVPSGRVASSAAACAGSWALQAMAILPSVLIAMPAVASSGWLVAQSAWLA